ncbi:hypothetical protein E0Y62_05050 [Cytobacillus praedii]|uniref:Uncharacterized protein n=1 Tax=Cytobacillus praedii TaxID=1742358 RepID=A0A4R1AY70_9BACI|nr:hypothetical protein E0Y62_05050 [Cytobacillus praedii]
MGKKMKWMTLQTFWIYKNEYQYKYLFEIWAFEDTQEKQFAYNASKQTGELNRVLGLFSHRLS